jgi:NNP family nitrate/nitrite transporter-like MFS transporter
MVPAVFRKLHAQSAEGKAREEQEAAITAGDVEASVALGFTSAIAATGLFFIPALVATSIQASGSAHLALVAFSVFYLTCVLTTWWWYRRRGAQARCD